MVSFFKSRLFNRRSRDESKWQNDFTTFRYVMFSKWMSVQIVFVCFRMRSFVIPFCLVNGTSVWLHTKWWFVKRVFLRNLTGGTWSLTKLIVSRMKSPSFPKSWENLRQQIGCYLQALLFRTTFTNFGLCSIFYFPMFSTQLM